MSGTLLSCFQLPNRAQQSDGKRNAHLTDWEIPKRTPTPKPPLLRIILLEIVFSESVLNPET